MPDGFRQYPDQPELENRKAAEGITGVRQQQNAVIPAHPGTYVLPELSLPWWNTETQALEYAVLPERRIQVTAVAPEAAIAPPALPTPGRDAQVRESTAPPAPEAGETGAAAALAPGISIWQWLTCVLAVAWLATLAYILKSRKSPRAQGTPPQAQNLRKTRKALEQACRDNDPERAKTALLQWAKVRPQDPPVSSLGALEKQAGEKLAAEIRNLSRRPVCPERRALARRGALAGFFAGREAIRRGNVGAARQAGTAVSTVTRSSHQPAGNTGPARSSHPLVGWHF